jgi:predicted CXXCH cytochrome family protein
MCALLWLSACDTAPNSVQAGPEESALLTAAPSNGQVLIQSAQDFLAQVVAGTPMPAVAQANPCFESGCHTELKAREQLYQHKPYAQGQCLDCHKTYHTENTQKQYTQSDIDLCISCHTDYKLGVSHPVGEGVIDPKTGQMMTCTSTCHLSHTAPYEFLLVKPGNGRLCVHCHEDFLQK